MYEEAKSTGGSLSIFGFPVVAGAAGHSEENVKTGFERTQWDNATGSMTIAPPSAQVYPTILAVLGERL